MRIMILTFVIGFFITPFSWAWINTGYLQPYGETGLDPSPSIPEHVLGTLSIEDTVTCTVDSDNLKNQSFTVGEDWSPLAKVSVECKNGGEPLRAAMRLSAPTTGITTHTAGGLDVRLEGGKEVDDMGGAYGQKWLVGSGSTLNVTVAAKQGSGYRDGAQSITLEGAFAVD